MQQFEILEHGQRFAVVDARDAEHALDIADREYPRRRSDYNMTDNDPSFTVEWCARSLGDDEVPTALRAVVVPSEDE